MKRTAFFTAVLARSPALALAHPGHSVLDVSLLAIAALANGVHWLARRR